MDAGSWMLGAGAILALVGWAGSVLPGLPGLSFIWAGALLIAWAGHFSKIGWGTLLVLAVLTLIGFAVDFLSVMLGAKRVGASRPAMVGAALGALGGLFFGIPRLVFGPFLGAVAGEALHQQRAKPDWARLGWVGLGTWLGMVVGTILKFLLALLMLGILSAMYFLG